MKLINYCYFIITTTFPSPTCFANGIEIHKILCSDACLDCTTSTAFSE